MINLNQLRVFYHAAKNLNFTTAAKELFITQPAVTIHMKSFEENCNLVLFKKKGRRVYLTAEGEALYKYAQKIFEYEKDIENAIEDMRELKRGILRLGTTKTYARFFMPFLIAEFRETYPKIKIQLYEGSSLEMTRTLLDFKIEVAIIAKAEENPDICFVPFSIEEVVVIAAPNHHLTKQRRVSFRELEKEPVIMKEIGSGTRKLVTELFARHGCEPNVLMETSNTEFIKQLVERGEGISFLVKEAAALELEAGKLASIQLMNKKIFLDVSIASLKNQHLSPPAKVFLETLKKLAGGDMPARGIGALKAKMGSQQTRTLPEELKN